MINQRKPESLLNQAAICPKNSDDGHGVALTAMFGTSPSVAHQITDLGILYSTGDCVGCDLSGLDLNNADLTGANLTNADLTRTILDDAIFCGTTMPDGTIRNDNC